MKKLIALIFVSGSMLYGAEEKDLIKLPGGPSFKLSPEFSATNITFGCGKGSITVNAENGSVSFKNCDPSEAGKCFWEAVTKAFPGIRKAIKESKE